MRVTLFPQDQTGCGRYRMIYPALAAKAAGYDSIEIRTRLPLWRRRDWSVAGIRDDFQTDVVVFQRPAALDTVEKIPMLQAKGIAVVVELDDDFAALHALHPAFEDLHPRNREINWHHLKRACQLADLVTVTTPALAARYGGPKARVLPNCVPEAMLSITADRDGRTIGWGGSTTTHVGDLTVTRGGVQDALERTGARFLQIGPVHGVKRDLSLAREPESTGPLPFDGFHHALAELDVGIVPLATSAFNAGKSALKMLEYSALRIASVVSPTPDNQRLFDAGIGLIAKDRARDWSRHLTRLIENPAAREDLAEKAHAIVAAEWTYEHNVWRWLEAWQEAVDRHHHRKAAA